MLGRQEKSMAGNRATGMGVQDGVEVVGLDGFVTGDAGGETALAEIYRPLKIAAIYARVSTERQEKEQTVDSQLDTLYRAAREGGYEIAPSHIFVDERRRRHRTSRRPGVGAMPTIPAVGG